MKATSLLILPLVLAACEAPPAIDPPVLRSRYLGHYVGPCNSWVTSAATGETYCSSPELPYSTAAAYVVAEVPKDDGLAYIDFNKKTPDEKKSLLVAEGEKVYGARCVACHQKEGTGLGTNFPPLANDPVANNGPVEEHIATILHGLSGKAINGVSYSGIMTPFADMLTDNEIAAVITYERNSWGNAGGVVEPSAVASARK